MDLALILFVGALFGGFLGSLSGLGGGIIIIPLLVLGLDIDIHYAIGVSLIAVIATSTGTSVAYIKEGYSNIRVGMLLETATCTGALVGVAVGTYLPTHVLLMTFAFFLISSALLSLFKKFPEDNDYPVDPWAKRLKLDSSYPVNAGGVLTYRDYHVQNVVYGYFMMFIAGILSGGLGLGAGTLKVIALDQIMKLPFKVSTTTSNFMIGATAATSAGLYLSLGYIDPFLTAPVVLGVTIGAIVGVRLLSRLPVGLLRKGFAFLLILMALQIISRVWGQ